MSVGVFIGIFNLVEYAKIETFFLNYKYNRIILINFNNLQDYLLTSPSHWSRVSRNRVSRGDRAHDWNWLKEMATEMSSEG